MKSKWLSRILLLSSGIIIGLICGIMLTYTFISKSFNTATNLVSLGYRAWEGNQAVNAYLKDKPETARYALNHHVEILNYFFENRNMDGFPEATIQDLAISYIRLGKVSKILAKSNDAELFYDRGYALYRQYRIGTDKEVPSREKFIDFVSRLDAQSKPTSLTFSDAVMEKSSDVSK